MSLARSIARSVAGSLANSVVPSEGGGSDLSDAMFTSLAVSADGWSLTGTIVNAKDGGTYSGLNDNASPGCSLEVTSKSWTTAGVETTTTRTVYATCVKRQPYPNGTSLDETENGANCDVEWALSERIYTNDTIVGATFVASFFTDDGTGGSSASNAGGTNTVTNNSALTYHEPQACWLTPDKERITSASWKPRLFVMHRHARQGQPVRAVKFTATDQSANSVTSTVSALTTGQYSGSSLYANWFEPDWTTLDSLTDGDVVTIDAVIYPWVGDAFTLSTDAETYPSPYLSTLKAVCDAGGTYGEVFAYVDGVGGGTPQASTSAATAASNPFASIDAAVDAAITLNNSTYSRNNTSGVTIRIPASTDIVNFGSNTLDTKTAGDLPLLIEGLNQATSTFETGNSANNDCPVEFKMKTLTIKRPTGGATGGIGFDGANTAAAMAVFEDCTFDLNSQSAYAAWIYRTGRTWFIGCDGDDAGQARLQGVAYKQAIIIGSNNFPCNYNPAHVIATTVSVQCSIGFFETSYGYSQGPCVAFCVSSLGSGTQNAFVFFDKDYGSRGACIVGCLGESYGTNSGAVLLFSGDGAIVTVTNGIEAMNTFAGGRTNIAYNDEVDTLYHLKDIVSKHSIHYQWNSKGDYQTTASGNRTGNWAIRHGVDGGYNLFASGDSQGNTTPAYNFWIGEALGDAKNEFPVGTVGTGSPDFITDASNTGTDVGGGNYEPGASTTAPSIPAGLTMFAVDLYGTAIPTDGSALAGAIQSTA